MNKTLLNIYINWLNFILNTIPKTDKNVDTWDIIADLYDGTRIK